MEIVQLWAADFFAPCVYAWRRNGIWLYVGQSQNGLARLGSSHHVIKARDIKPHDELLVWRVQKSELNELERKLIATNRPVHNVANKPPLRVSRSVLPEQINEPEPPRPHRATLSDEAMRSLDASAISELIGGDYQI